MIKHLLRKLRSICWTALSLCVILLAAVVGLLHLALPHVGALKERIEANLSVGLKRSVSVASLSGDWIDGRPVLQLRGLKLGANARAVAFEVAHAELTLDALALLTPGNARVFELSLLDQELKIVRQTDGRIMLAGFGLQGSIADHFVLDEGALNLKAAQLRYEDQRSGESVALKNIDLRLLRKGSQITLGGSWFQGARNQRSTAPNASLVVELDLSQGNANGRIYFLANQINLRTLGLGTLAPQLIAGEVSGALWAKVHDGEIASLKAQPQLRGLLLRPPGESVGVNAQGRIAFDSVAMTVDAKRSASALDITLSNIQIDRDGRASDGFLHATVDTLGGDQVIELQAQRLRIEDFAAAAMVSGQLTPALRAQLITAAPAGELTQLTLRARRGDLAGANASITLRGLHSNPVNNWPGVSGLDVTLKGSDAEGLLTVVASNGTLDWPTLLREQLVLKTLALPLSYTRSDAGLSLQTLDLALQTQDLSARGRLALDFPKGAQRPLMDMQLAIDGLEIVNARRYWPLRGFSPKSRQWLDQGLLGGQLLDGEILLHGDLADWPFRGNRGRFEASGRVANAELKFNPEWPTYAGFDADLAFVNQSLDIRASGGNVVGNPIRTAHAVIDDYKAAVLKIEYDGAEQAAALANLIRSSPLNQSLGRIFDNLDANGPASTTGRFQLTLKPGVKDLQLEGQLRLDGVRFTQPQWTLDLTEARGELVYTQTGVSGDGIALRDGPMPLSMNLRGGRDTGVANQPFRAEGRVHASIQQLLGDAPQLKSSLLDPVTGSSEFDVTVRVARTAAGAPLRAELELQSDLTGIALGFPAPLHKSPFGKQQMRFVTPLPLGSGPMQLKLAGLGRAELLYADRRIAGVELSLGSASAPRAQLGAFTVRGQMGALALGEWLALSETISNIEKPLTFGPFDLEIARLQYLNRTFPNVALGLKSGLRATEVTVASETVRGTLAIPRSKDLADPIRADFSVLKWPAGDAASVASDVDPTALRALVLNADSVQFQHARLGRIELVTEPQPDGLKVRRFSSTTGDSRIDAAGTWTRAGSLSQSRFQINVSAISLDALLRNFDYAGRVEGAPTKATFDVSWDGAPADFALERLSGLLSTEIGPGRLLSVEPGPGRIFGLLSLEAIPRRLTLDFSDMFEKGLTFDRIKGDFQLSAGQAYTQGLTITGPSVDITIKGRTGLMARDYAQDMLVAPKFGNTLPIVGALAGGPAGAAAAWLVSGILSKPLSQIARYRYSVTGPWDAPKVVPMAAAARSPERAEG